MNILQISSSDRAGGAERIALTLHEALGRLGHDARMAVGEKLGGDPKILEIPNTRERSYPARWAYRLPPWMRSRNLKGSYFVQRALIRLCEPARGFRLSAGNEDFEFPGTMRIPDISGFVPDVLHAHNLHGRYFDLRRLSELSNRFPFIITLHDAWLISGHCAHSFACEKWLEGCGACPNLEIPPEIPVDNTARNWRLKRDIYAAGALYTASVSRFLHDKVVRSMVRPRIAKVIHNGIDLDRFRPAEDVGALRRKWGIPESAKVAVFAAAGVKKNFWKDFETLERTMESVAERYRGPGKLVLLCVGESGQRRSLGRGEIMFAGYLKDQATMAECYQLADLYLHPTKADSFPNVILEAMACGVPSVASAIGGIPEQIQDGRNGFLCPGGDAEAMAARCLSILEDADTRRRLGEAGLVICRERFSLARQVAAYLDFYGEVREDFRSRAVSGC